MRDRGRHSEQINPAVWIGELHSPEIPAGEERLDPADPRRTVDSQSGDRFVGALIEACAHTRSEVRFGVNDLLPSGHDVIVGEHARQAPAAETPRPMRHSWCAD